MRCTDIIIMEVACYATCTIPKKSQKEKKKKKTKTRPNQGAWKQNMITRIGKFERHIKRES